MSRAPLVSVVVATYNRAESARLLLDDLASQTLLPGQFEVIVVDDGSAVPVEPTLMAATRPYPLFILRQPNGGPAAARHRAIERARGELIVIVDDDMRVGADFLAQHAAAHPAGTRRVALGLVRPDPAARLSLFERFHTHGIAQAAADADVAPLRGSRLYTGNVSFRRTDYVAVGGFDSAFRVSEDAELGIRLEQAGVAFVSVPRALSLNGSGHASLAGWLRRSCEYGATDARIAEKHPDLPEADPWRFLAKVNAISRPWLIAAARTPRAGRALGSLAARLALVLDGLGLERIAVAGLTFGYGAVYYAGVGARLGSRRAVGAALDRLRCRSPYAELGFFARLAKLRAEIRADHDALRRADDKYASSAKRGHGLVADGLQRIGFQMMIAYRVMRFFWGSGDRWTAKLCSRLIRHAYGADLHWEAQLAPGVIIVHGAGLIVSHAARVATGCILFQHVTLGESIHPETRLVGGPTLEAGVHVGPGATLLGPITVGARSKIMAGVVVTCAVPADSVVEAAQPVIRTRASSTPVSRVATAAVRPLTLPRTDGAQAATR